MARIDAYYVIGPWVGHLEISITVVDIGLVRINSRRINSRWINSRRIRSRHNLSSTFQSLITSTNFEKALIKCDVTLSDENLSAPNQYRPRYCQIADFLLGARVHG